MRLQSLDPIVTMCHIIKFTSIMIKAPEGNKIH